MVKHKIFSDVKMVKINEIKPNKYNPNQMTDEQFDSLVLDFKENGFVGQPIIVNKDKVIIDGEHRWRSASFCHFKKVPVIEFHPKDKDHQRLLTIGWNAKRGEFNPLKLAEVIQRLNKKYTPEELSSKLGFTENQIKDWTEISQVTPEMIKKIKKEAEEMNKGLPVVFNFAMSKEQGKLIYEALDVSIGKSKGEKLYYICHAFLKDKPIK